MSYDDGSSTVFVATLTNSIGWLTASNQVTYRNCFAGIQADLVCTYRRGGFECDLVLREQPPTPEVYGLDLANSTLQLVTEFFSTQDPQQIPSAFDEWYGLQDETLKFGKMTMGRGRAFAVNSQNSQPSTLNSQPVYKRWVHLQSRTFLIEEVPLNYIADDLRALPMTAKLKSPTLLMASVARRFPPGHEFVMDTNRIQVAVAELNGKPGVVLDYNEIGSAQTDFTFQSGTTYYISGPFSICDTTTIEAGTII